MMVSLLVWCHGIHSTVYVQTKITGELKLFHGECITDGWREMYSGHLDGDCGLHDCGLGEVTVVGLL